MPKGDRIAFFREKLDGMYRVYVVSSTADEAEPGLVMGGEQHNFYPSFLLDGRVGYTRVPGGEKQLAVSIADGTALEVMLRGGVSYARWSQDGERVAFVAGRWPSSAVHVPDAEGKRIEGGVN